MNILKQSTAATIKLGPFVDDTDGKTAETALTIGQADIRLSKNGGDIAQSHNTAGATHDELGYYNVPLDATDTNTLGRLLVAVHESGALPVWKEFMIVTANVYDTLCSTDALDVNVTSLADDVITSAKFDEATAFPVKSADTGATALARTGADADTLETLSDQIDLIDVSGIADAVWDEALAGHMIAGSAGITLLNSGTSLSSILLLLSTSPSVLQHRCMNNDDLICRKSADFAASFIYLGDLSGVTDLYFTVKPQTKVNSYLDSQATIQIQEGVGLLYINSGVAGVPANGSITVTDAINGHLTINLDAVETAKLTANTNYRYDIKADHNIIAEGNFYIQSAVTLTV